jgi:hypothetical protein
MTDEQREPTIEAIPNQKTQAELKVERHTRKVVEWLGKVPSDRRASVAAEVIQEVEEMLDNETRAPST